MSADVHLIVGKLCVGKTRYARELVQALGGIMLSCDELMLSMFPHGLGAQHDEYALRARKYLYGHAMDIARAGICPVLDFGFWRRDERMQLREYFRDAGLETRWHYVTASEHDFMLNVQERNAQVSAGSAMAYIIDEGLLRKQDAVFEAPTPDEIDLYHVSRRYDA